MSKPPHAGPPNKRVKPPPPRPPPLPSHPHRGVLLSNPRLRRYPDYVATSTYERDGLVHVASSLVPFCFLIFVPRTNRNSTSQFEKFHRGRGDRDWRPPTPLKLTHVRHARKEYLLTSLSRDRTRLELPRHPRVPDSLLPVPVPPHQLPVTHIHDHPILIRHRLRYFSLCIGCHLRIGRHHDNDIVISQRHVSRFHCEIWVGRSRRGLSGGTPTPTPSLAVPRGRGGGGGEPEQQQQQQQQQLQPQRLIGGETLAEMNTGESSSDRSLSSGGGGGGESSSDDGSDMDQKRKNRRKSKVSASSRRSSGSSSRRRRRRRQAKKKKKKNKKKSNGGHGGGGPDSGPSEFREFLDQFDVGLYVHGESGTNGTRVNQEDIQKDERRLYDGDCVSLCGHDFYVCMGPKSLHRTLKAIREGRLIGGGRVSRERKKKRKKKVLGSEEPIPPGSAEFDPEQQIELDESVDDDASVEVDAEDDKLAVGDLDMPILRSETRRAKKTAVYFDQRMALHYDHLKSHPECPLRISTIQQEMTRAGLMDRCLVLSDRPATNEELLLCHSQDHIDEVLSPQVFSKNDFYKCNDTPIAVRLAVGGVIDIVERVCRGEVENGFAMIRPPGHHATRDQFKGFCFFNNVGVAARVAASKYGKRVAIVDWDVHHGNGTQEIFEKDPTILYFSTHRHGFDFYPGTGSIHDAGTGPGEGFCVNVGFGSPYGDADQLGSFLQILLPILYDFQPDLILVSAGFDAVAGDPLGACIVAPEMFGVMTALLQAVTKNVVLSLEGGYNVNQTANSVLHCLRVLLGESAPRIPKPVSAMSRGTEALLGEVKKIHGDRWKLLRGPTRRLAAPTSFPERATGRKRRRMPAWRMRDEIRRYRKRKRRHSRRVLRRQVIRNLIEMGHERESSFLEDVPEDMLPEYGVPPPPPPSRRRAPSGSRSGSGSGLGSQERRVRE